MNDSTGLPAAQFLNNKTPPHIITLVLFTGVGAMNMNIILPSLPAMADYFNTDYAIVQLALSAYLGMTAILQLLVGPLSDRYGRRPIILISFCIFIVASLLTATATSFEMYMLGRLIQAAIVSGYALSRAIVRDIVPMEEAASMIGYITMGMALVPMLSPTIGGLLQEFFGWQSINILTAILGGAILVLIYFDLGETNQNPTTSFGAQFKEYPDLITSRRFWGYTLTSTFASGSYFAYLGGAPYSAEQHFGLSPSTIGLYFGLVAIGYMGGNFLSGRYTKKVGIHKMMLNGGVIVNIGISISIVLFLMGINHPAALFVPIIAVGLGNGMTLPSTMAGIVSVRPHLAGSASGLGGALMIGGGASLSVLAGILLTPTSGPLPLLYLMLASGIASILSILYTAKVEKSIANQQA